MSSRGKEVTISDNPPKEPVPKKTEAQERAKDMKDWHQSSIEFELYSRISVLTCAKFRLWKLNVRTRLELQQCWKPIELIELYLEDPLVYNILVDEEEGKPGW